MSLDSATLKRLGYGDLDLMVGDWFSCDDVVSHAFVRHPEQDNRQCIRELLRLLGKRFPSPLAQLIWQEVENYRHTIREIYGPPAGAIGEIDFDQAVREWYAAYGPAFEKRWYLEAPLELHFAPIARERVSGRWVGLFHAELVHFVESGFTAFEVLKATGRVRAGWLKAWRAVKRPGPEQARFWLELAAYLFDYRLSPERLEELMQEIVVFAARLGQRQGYPATTAQAALDYFRRLEKGELRLLDVAGQK